MTGSEREPRWKVCTSAVLESLPQAAGALYVGHYFNQTSQARVVDMVANIRKAYRGMIVESDWMDPKTKQYALEKVQQRSAEFPIEWFLKAVQDLVFDSVCLSTVFCVFPTHFGKFSMNNRMFKDV